MLAFLNRVPELLSPPSWRPLPHAAPRLLRQLRLPMLDSYILVEFLGPFVFAFLAFFLFWGFNIFFCRQVSVTQNAPFFLVMRFVVFRVPQSIPMAFPLRRSSRRCSAWAGDGGQRDHGDPHVGRFALAPAVTPFLFGLPSSGHLGDERIRAPKAVDLSTRTFYQIIYHTAALPMEPQFFRKDPDTGNVFFVSQVLPDGKTMAGVQIFKPGRSGYWNETIQAKTARVEGATLVLKDAVLTYYNPHGYETSQTTTPEFRIGLPLAESAAQFMSTANSDAWTMNSKHSPHR